MPQMKPSLWIFILTMTLTMLILININTYFTYLNILSTKNFSKNSKTPLKTIKWKWLW